MLLDLLAYDTESTLFVKLIVGIKTIICGPVDLVPVLRAQKGTDGVPAMANQVSKVMATSSIEGLFRSK